MLGRVWKSKWHPRSAAEYVLLAGLPALATGKVFHNNYLVWLLPLVALLVGETVLASRAEADRAN
jgi:hypothetical protein